MTETKEIHRFQNVSSVGEIIEIANLFGPGCSIIFRGENDTFETLQPKIGRIFRNMKSPLALEILSEKTDDDEARTYFRDIELDSYRQFFKMCEPHIGFRPEKDDALRALVLGHHYGLPTRLLDWTQNILVGAFFAVQNNPGRDCRIYTLNTEEEVDLLDLLAETNELVAKFSPPFIHQRIINQASIFTVHPNPLDDLLRLVTNDPEYNEVNIEVLEIKGSKVKKLAEELSYFGVNASTIWPDLSGVANHVEWYLSNEML